MFKPAIPGRFFGPVFSGCAIGGLPVQTLSKGHYDRFPEDKGFSDGNDDSTKEISSMERP